ncbi:MAG: energy-coupling factor transporter transmembrane protein EcfT [Eubacterium sp.]
MRRLPSGIFITGNSVLHRLDATVKIILFFILAAAAVLADSAAGYCLAVFFTSAAVLLSKTGLKAAAGNVMGMAWFFITVFLMNFLFFGSENTWFSFWIFHPSCVGMLQGIKAVSRIILFLILSNILNSTTPPMQVTGAIENLLFPLSFIKVPVGQIALILSAAIQFIPILSEEAQMIKKVQTARGAGFDSRSLFGRAKAVLALLVPLFISAFRHADELSLSMEARGCRAGSNKRNRTKVHIGRIEILLLAFCSMILAVQIFIF